VLRHCVTGVDWAQADNGVDVDREAAGAWCAKKGGAWELPTANALAELIDRSGRSSTPCGRDKCYVSPHFRLTAPTYWSRDPVGPATAMLVHLLLGGRHPALLHISRGYRALCIRRPDDRPAVRKLLHAALDGDLLTSTRRLGSRHFDHAVRCVSH
jgi:hypothetical protein